jgi:hypothetical protein
MARPQNWFDEKYGEQAGKGCIRQAITDTLSAED